ncbi:Ig-like domain-containing protein [Pirellulaceae bacterium SH501]
MGIDASKSTNRIRSFVQSKREQFRRMVCEGLERRDLMAADGPRLLSVAPNAGELFSVTRENTLTESPRELVLRFDSDVTLGSLADGIQIIRSGGDRAFGATVGVSNPLADVREIPAFLNFGESNRIVIARFSQPLPDDLYSVQVLGVGSPTPIQNAAGQSLVPRISGTNRDTLTFDLELGTKIIAVVPQPVDRAGNGAITQRRADIEVYFNDNELYDQAITTGLGANPSVVDRQFYKLILTKDTVSPNDDEVFEPTSISYDPVLRKATLTFAQDIDALPSTPGAGTFRLRVGSNSPVANSLAPIAPNTLTPGVDPAGTLNGAINLTGGGSGTLNGSFSTVINQEIRTLGGNQLLLDFPGSNFEPGHRDIQDESHVDGSDGDPAITTRFYSFMDNQSYGVDVQGRPLFSSINSDQRQRVREVFEFFSAQLGIDFVERVGIVQGGDIQVVVGDMAPLGRVSGPGDVIGVAGGDLAIMDASEQWDNSFGQGSNIPNSQSFFDTTMHEVGHVLGFGHTYDLPPGTIMGAANVPGYNNNVLEQIYPANADVIHGQHLYRPDNRDVDLYRFEVPVSQAGTVRIETFAERLNNSSNLDTYLTLLKREADGSLSIVGANNNYFSDDSFIQADLGPGEYFISVTGKGNEDNNPLASNTGSGAVSQGQYQLRFDFKSTIIGQMVEQKTGSTAAGSALDGDGDGIAGGDFNFWFRAASPYAGAVAPPTTGPARTLFVDKAYLGVTQVGSLAQPFTRISDATAAARPGDIIRLVGDNRTPNNLTDDRAYEIGDGGAAVGTLSDGATLNVPRGVTLMIDAGAILKFGGSGILVGSNDSTSDRSSSAIQVLGIPGLPVYMTSYNDQSLGQDTNPLVTTPAAGNWGGIEIRNDFDRAQGRFDREREGVFLNTVSNADIRFGGGQVGQGALARVVSPIDLSEARPLIVNNIITRSGDAAISADPNSFEETLFTEPRYQHVGAFIPDYDRVGPDIRSNIVRNNSINGLFIKIDTTAGGGLEQLTVPGRIDDSEITVVLGENLIIQGTPGGAGSEALRPNISLVTLNPVSLATPGFAAATAVEYLMTYVDRFGQESLTSAVTTGLVAAGQTIRLDNLPTATLDYVGRKLYRRDNNQVDGGGAPVYRLVANLNRDDNQYFDAGGTIAGGLQTLGLNSVSRARRDASLVVDPGTVIKALGGRIEVGISATLLAEGTEAKPIVFTSRLDDRFGAGGSLDTNNDGTGSAGTPGDWAGIVSRHLGELSLDNTVITFGGGNSRVPGGFASFNAIEVHQSTARIANSLIENNASGRGTPGTTNRDARGQNDEAAIFVLASQPVIINNVIRNNREGTGNLALSTSAISIDANSLNFESVRDYGRMTGANAREPIGIGNFGPLVSNNRLGGNAINGMTVRGATLSTESVWDDTDIVHVLQSEIVIPDFHTYGGLRLTSRADESLVVKLNGANAGFTAAGRPLDITDRIGGTLQLLGSPGFPVVLTSLADDSIGAGFDFAGRSMLDTNNNGNTVPTPGSWRSVRFEPFSNDRNVDQTYEREPDLLASVGSNDFPATAEDVGSIAPNLSSGDENLRLGVTLTGAIASPSDLDVYRFIGTAGTTVWFDIDQTSGTLDSVVEIIDANGQIIALSNHSLDESLASSVYSNPSLIPAGRANPMDQEANATTNSFLGTDADFQGVNPLDAGFRVVLPGSAGSINNYFVRVRSSNVSPVPGPGGVDRSSTARLTDPSLVRAGITVGQYKLHMRLQQTQELSGSTVRYADIRYASTGIEARGVGIHSPLVGEFGETNPETNNALLTAQTLGSLFASDRASLSVAGAFANSNDIDFFRFTARRDSIQQVSTTPSAHVSVVFDLDYADGLARANTQLWVFRPDGTLVLMADDSNIHDDQPAALKGADTSDLSRGSMGTRDAFLGPFELPPGDYVVAVTNKSQSHVTMRQFSDTDAGGFANIRVEPIDSVRRISEDRFDTLPAARPSVNTPPVQVAFSAASAVPFNFSDVTLFTATGRNVNFNNPLTGVIEATYSTNGTSAVNYGANTTMLDMAVTPAGQGIAYQQATGGVLTDANSGNFIGLDIGNGAPAVGNSGLTTTTTRVTPNSNPPTFEVVQVPNNGGNNGVGLTFDGLAFSTVGTTDLGGGALAASFWGVASRNGGGFQPIIGIVNGTPTAVGIGQPVVSRNILYRLSSYDGTLGAALNPSGSNGLNAAQRGWGAGTNQMASGFFVQQAGTTDINNNVVGYTEAIGTVSGLASIGNRLYAVTNAGELMGLTPSLTQRHVFSDSYVVINDPDSNQPIQFTSLTAGPRNLVEGSINYSQLLFGVGTNGRMYAFNTDGVLQNIFPGARSYVESTGLANVSGISFSSLDTNLWHLSERNTAEAGHGRQAIFSESSDLQTGTNVSLRFGYADPNANQRTQSGNYNGIYNTPALYNTVAAPGGARGAIESALIDLREYSANDQPYLYFNYRLDTQNSNSGIGDNQAALDTFRVYVSAEDGQWTLLGTNNSPQNNSTRIDFADNFLTNGSDEFDVSNTGVNFPNVDPFGKPPITSEFFDNQGWRQARVSLATVAGLRDVKLRFEFATGGEFRTLNTNLEPDATRNGIEITAVAGDRFFDGGVDGVIGANVNTFTLGGTVFEFDLGLVLNLPSGASLKTGDQIKIGTQLFTFSNAAGPQNIPFNAAQTPDQIATNVLNVLTANGYTVARHSTTRNVLNVTERAGNPLPAPTAVGDYDILGADKAIIIGEPGVVTPGAQPVNITNAMTAVQVRDAVRVSMARAFNIAGQENNIDIYRVRGNTILFHNTLQTAVSNSSRLIITDGRIGDRFGAADTPNPRFTSSFRAQQNNVEGLQIDDIIIGFAERGEVIYNAPTNNSTFVPTPFYEPILDSATRLRANEVETGTYQLEIRAAADYGTTPPGTQLLLNGLNGRAFNTNDRLSKGYALQFNSASQLRDGAFFTLSDGVNTARFEFNVITSSTDPAAGVTSGSIPITVLPNATAVEIVRAIRDAINSPVAQSVLKITASTGGDMNGIGGEYPARSLVIFLNGSAAADTAGGTLGFTNGGAQLVFRQFGQETAFGEDLGDSNTVRDQGQFIISSTVVRNSQNFGINVDAAAQQQSLWSGSTGIRPYPGAVRNLVNFNSSNVAPGVVVMNNVLYGNVAGGITVSGDTGTNNNGEPPRTVARLLNNTLYGTGAGTGINVNDGALPTILNNAISNFGVGISVTANSLNGTEVGGNIYKLNGTNTSAGLVQSFPINLGATDPLFNDPANGRFYLQALSQAIDSSVASLENRSSIEQVKSAIGLPTSSILAPSLDVNGLRRSDDPAVNTPAGLGQNVFIDRGAIDRVDFVGPSAVLLNPLDNDAASNDGDLSPTNLILRSGTYDFFEILLDESSGTGVDPVTANFAATVVVTENGRRLIPGSDYEFGYSVNSRTIRLTPLGGFWRRDSVYEVTLVNQSSHHLTVPAGSAVTDGQQIRIVRGSNTFVLEFDSGNGVSGGATAIPFTNTTSAIVLAGRIMQALSAANIVGAGINTFALAGDSLMITGAETVTTPLPVVAVGAIRDLAGNELRANRANSLTQFTIAMPEVAIDYGDAIERAGTGANSATLLALNGARHAVYPIDEPLLVLGQYVDADTNGTTSPGVDGDDNDSSVVFSAGMPFAIGQSGPARLVTTASGAALVGRSITIRDNVNNTVVFRFTDGTVTLGAGEIGVTVLAADSADTIAESLRAAIYTQAIETGRLFNMVARRSGNVVALDGTLNHSFDLSNVSGLIRRENTGTLSVVVQKTNGVDNLVDGQTLTIADGSGSAIAFQLIDTSAGTPTSLGAGNVAVRVNLLTDSDADIAAAFRDAINAAITARRLNLPAVSLTGTELRILADDEDGVRFQGFFNPGATPVVTTVTSSGAGFLDVWIDWNQDNDFNDPGEQMLDSVPVVAGANVFNNFATPAGAAIGYTTARFRLSTTGGLSPTGLALGGEVEDHLIEILPGLPPVAVNDPSTAAREYRVLEDSILNVSRVDGVLANDTDADETWVFDVDPFTSTIDPVLAPQNGTLEFLPETSGPDAGEFKGAFRYTPNRNFFGIDTFVYQVRDARMISNTPATVTINVLPVNDAPVGVDDQITINEDGTDTETVPTRTVTWNSSLFTANDIRGRHSDGTVATNEASQNLRVIAASFVSPRKSGDGISVDTVNNTITFNPGDHYNDLIDGKVIISLTIEDDGDTGVIRSAELSEVNPLINANPLTSTSLLTITINPLNDRPLFTLDTNLISEVEDPNPAARSFDIVKNVVPGPALAIDELSGATAQTVSNFEVNVVANHPDPSSLFAVAPAVVGTGTARSLQYTLAPDINWANAGGDFLNTDGLGNIVLELVAVDSGLNDAAGNVNRSVVQRVTIQIQPVNDAPEFTVPATHTSLEDAGLVTVPGFITGIRPGTVTSVDETRDQTVQFEVVGWDSNLFVSIPTISADGTLTYQIRPDLNSNYNAPVGNAAVTPAVNPTIEIELVDNGPQGGNNVHRSVRKSFQVVVTPVNDTPVPNIHTAEVPEDVVVTIQSSAVLVGDRSGPIDEDLIELQQLRITRVDLVTAQGGTIVPVFDGTTDRILSFNYTPPANYNGPDSLTYTVTDNGSPERSETGTISLTVLAVNDAPTFTPGADVVVLEDAAAYSQSWAADVSPGPANESTQTVRFEVQVTPPATFPNFFAVAPTIAPDGTLAFTLSQDANGSAIVEVVAIDDGPSGGPLNHVNRSTVHTLTITAQPVNDAPVFNLSQTLLEHPEDPTPALRTYSIVNGIAGARSTALDELLDQSVNFDFVVLSAPGRFAVEPRIVGTGADRVFEYQLAPDVNRVNSNGDILVEVYAVDDGPFSTPPANVNRSPGQIITIRVTEVNDPPLFDLSFNTLTIEEDAPLQTFPSFYLNELAGPSTAVDELLPAATGQTVTRSVSVPPEAVDLYAVLPRLNANGDLEFQYRQDVNSNFAALRGVPGLLNIIVTATDDGREDGLPAPKSTTKTLVVNVTPVNDAPFAALSTNRVEVIEDAGLISIPNFAVDVRPATNTVAGQITALDEATQTLTFVMNFSNPALFDQAPQIDATGRLTFRTAPDQNGTSVVTARLIDNGANSPAPNTNLGPIVTFTIVANAINDAPEFTLPSTLDVVEDQGVVSIPGFATAIRPGPTTAADEGRQTLAFNLVQFDANVFDIPPTLQADGTLSFRTRLNVNSNTANISRVVAFQLQDGGVAGPSPNSNLSIIRQFTLNIAPVNDPPIPDVFVVAGTEDRVVTVQAVDVLNLDEPGPEDERLIEAQTVRMTQIERTSERGGSVVPVFTGGVITSFQYTPPSNLVGDDIVRYVVTDNGSPERSATGTIIIRTAGVNDPPQFAPGADVNVLEDAAPYSQPWATDILAGPINAPDEWSGATAQQVTFTATASNPAFFSVQPAVDSNGVLTFTLARDVNGIVTVDIVAVDNGATGGDNVNTSSPHRLTISVGSLNDAPGFVLGPTIVYDEDLGAYSGPFVDRIVGAEGMNSTPPTGTDEAGQSVAFEVTNSNNSLFLVQPAIDPTGRLTFTPAADAFGAVQVFVVGVDNGPSSSPNVNRSAPKTFIIDLQPLNDAPFAVNDRYTTTEDSVLTISAPGVIENDRDVDLPNDTLTVVLPTGAVTTALGATVTLNANGSFVYDPRGAQQLQRLTVGEAAVDTFTYTIRDSSGLTSNLGTVSLTVTGINDNPVAVNDSFSIAAGQATSLNVLANDTDIDSSIDVRTIEIGRLPVNGTVTVLSTGRVEYRPNAGYVGADSFTYRFRDALGAFSNEATVTVNSSTPPVAVDDTLTIVRNRQTTINVLRNDFDPDSAGGLDPATVTIASGPDVGGALVQSNGDVVYTPPTGFTGTATFQYFVSDRTGQPSNLATVTLRVVSSLHQNPTNRFDVDDDGFVSPIDVLLIVNDINFNGTRTLPDDFGQPPYLDVNGSGGTDPLDVLDVINFINNRGSAGAGAEGEAPALWAPIDVEILSNQRYLELAREKQANIEMEVLSLDDSETGIEPVLYGPLAEGEGFSGESLEDYLAMWIVEDDETDEKVDELFSDASWL